jgi:hypothetical protein
VIESACAELLASDRTWWMLRRLGGSIALAAALCALLPVTALATLTVTNTNDTGPGSLRETIEAAAPGETIVVPSGTYALTSGELALAKSLTLQGAGAGSTIVTAGGKSKVMAVYNSGSVVRIAGMTIRDGADASGGAGIAKQEGALTLEGVVLTENVTDASGKGKPGGIGRGGAIYNKAGQLTVIASTISANKVKGGGGEGSPGGIVYGGAIYSEGPFTIASSTLTGNTIEAPGGQKPAGTGQSGGIAYGGAVYGAVTGGAVEIANTTVSGNTANVAGGPGENPGGIAGGGGIYLSTENVAIALSGVTVSGNKVLAPAGSAGSSGGITEGGGLLLRTEGGSAALTNATVTENTASSAPGKSGIAAGGGVRASSEKTSTQIVNGTLDANVAESPTGGKGGDLSSVGSTKLTNTIVSAGVAAAGTENCSEAVESQGHNIDSRNQCGFKGAGDQVNTDPLLAPLAANGGSLQTQALSVSSPAANAGTNSGCPATDARGVVRPQGLACDIGAFELAPPAAATSPASAVGATAAILHGNGSNPDVLAGAILFQYGTTTAYGAQTTAAVLAGGASSAPSSSMASGLKPTATYHFRAVVTTPEGTAFGADQTFTTTARPPAAPSAPVLRGLRVSPQNLRALRGSGASISRTRRGATIAYRDSQAARTTFTVQRIATGFRVGRRCVARPPSHRHGKPRHCARLLTMGTFAHSDAGGPVKLKFTGRAGGHPLRPGSYRLTAVARNSGGLKSAPALTTFRIVR